MSDGSSFQRNLENESISKTQFKNGQINEIEHQRPTGEKVTITDSDPEDFTFDDYQVTEEGGDQHAEIKIESGELKSAKYDTREGFPVEN